MGRATLEVADIFREFGPARRQAQRGHLSLGQLKVMSAVEQCRCAALGGHVLRCEGCGTEQVAYNSCRIKGGDPFPRSRHCPKCQCGAAKRWLDAGQADLLPVEYHHVVFTLPAPVSDIAYRNKAVVYGLLFGVAAGTLVRVAADPKHLDASIGDTLVLHTWGSAMTHHPHVHGIVPGGGLAPDGKRWIACRPGLFLPVRVLSRLFRRRFVEELLRVHEAGKLQFFGEHAALADATAFRAWLAPLRQCEWVVWAKRSFAGPQAVLAYLSRYTHRVLVRPRVRPGSSAIAVVERRIGTPVSEEPVGRREYRRRVPCAMKRTAGIQVGGACAFPQGGGWTAWAPICAPPISPPRMNEALKLRPPASRNGSSRRSMSCMASDTMLATANIVPALQRFAIYVG